MTCLFACPASRPGVQFLNGALMISKYANIGCDSQSIFDNFPGRQFSVLQQGTGRSLRIGPPEPIAIRDCSGSITSPLPLMISELSLSATANSASRRRSAPFGTPCLGQFHRRSHQLSIVFLKLGLEQLEKRESVCCASSKNQRARDSGIGDGSCGRCLSEWYCPTKPVHHRRWLLGHDDGPRE